MRQVNREKRVIAVTGATGQIGRVLTEELLARGHAVRAIGRDAEKLARLEKEGAETVSADFTDGRALARAFAGVDAVFSLVPPSYGAEDFGAYQDRAGTAIAGAIRVSGVKHVLSLSSIGAHLAEGNGPIRGLHRHERRLDELEGASVLHLRPGYFMQNFLWSIPLLQAKEILSGSIRPDVPLPLISTNDIGRKAAELLDRLDFPRRAVLEIAGPSSVTLSEAARIVGEALGRAVSYVPVSYEEETQALLNAGMKPSISTLLVEMSRGYNEGRIAPTQELTRDHRTPTSFSIFAKELARLVA